MYKYFRRTVEGLRLEQSAASLCEYRDASRERCCAALSINGRIDGYASARRRNQPSEHDYRKAQSTTL